MTQWSHLTGKKFYHLTVIYPAPDRIKHWRCFCTCGKFVTVAEKDLYSGDVSSCGCLPPIDKSSRNFGESFVTHGMSRSPEYRSWQNLKQRCLNSESRDFCGKKMYEPWAESFDDFFLDMGEQPESRMRIDLIDPEGDYEPGNCRWISSSKQQIKRLMEIING